MSLRRSVCLLFSLLLIGSGSLLRGGAIGISTLHLFDLTFNLFATTEGVAAGVPFESVTYFGTWTGGKAGTQQNWLDPPFLHLGPFDPLDPSQKYEIHTFNGPVTASAPPPDESLIDRTTGRFYEFVNFSSDPTDIDVHWHGRYSLLAMGDHSSASIVVRIGTKDLATGGNFLDNVLLNDSLVNDNKKLLQEAAGDFVISIAGATEGPFGLMIPGITELRFASEATARAAVPEPGYAGMVTLALILGWGTCDSRSRKFLWARKCPD
jgi:hypothetical protein